MARIMEEDFRLNIDYLMPVIIIFFFYFFLLLTLHKQSGKKSMYYKKTNHIFTECGGIMELVKGVIKSPNYPNNYDMNSYCEWIVRVEPTHTMKLTFDDFDLEASPNCASDSVEVLSLIKLCYKMLIFGRIYKQYVYLFKIYEGTEKLSQKQLFKSCGSKTKNSADFERPIKSYSNEVLVVFKSNDYFETKGFTLNFETVNMRYELLLRYKTSNNTFMFLTQTCGSHIVTNSTGIIEIGHNLRWYVDDCQWTIEADNPCNNNNNY